MDIEGSSGDICRVCRCESTSDRPLFHPCICTGSIKYIHQECLTQWMKYSRKEFCELCGHHFSFAPIYSPDMPRRLPIKDLVGGLVRSTASVLKCWLHYVIVAIAWLGVVPLSAYRIYRCFFMPSIESIMSLPFDLFSTDNIALDVLYGTFVVTCTLLSFIGLVWLREQILHGGGPDWLDRDHNPLPLQQDPVPAVLENDPSNNNVPDNSVEQQNGGDNEGENGEQVDDIDEHGDDNEEDDDNGEEDGDEEDDGAADDNNWMPMEWERAAEELTWERLLGLDGSLLFIEHVFWIISLNALFILIFGMIPYQIGNQIVSLFNINDWVIACHFERLITILIGYCHIGLAFVLLHYAAAFFNLRKSKRFLGLGYVVVKVSILSVIEIGLVPLICGWWLDICSLTMFGATLREREASFQYAPGTIMFIHWLVGMIYVYYFASFILLIREVVRPGALWFLQNLNDPDFSPIQEMIHIPIVTHIRRLIVTTLIFCTNILLLVWWPVRILHYCWPSFLPYNFTQNFDQHTNELSLDILLLQIILPSLLEQSYTRVWLKGFIGHWCKVVAWLLNLKSYILGDYPVNDTGAIEPVANNNNGDGAGAGAGGVLLQQQRDGPTGYQPYQKPKWFGLRLVGLIIMLGVSLVFISIMVLTVPVWIGRQLLKLYVVTMHTFIKKVFMVALPITITETASGIRFHELYTTALGVYVCWLVDRILHWLIHWLPQGRAAITQILYKWFLLSTKAFVVSVMVLGIIPLLFGLVLEQIIIIPLRTPLYKTPLLFLWYDWALGLLYTKIACCVIMMGPNWYLKAALERAVNNGFREMDFEAIIKDIIVPIVTMFGLALSVPYIVTHSVMPIFISNAIVTVWIKRLIYPVSFLSVVGYMLISLEIRHFKRLYEHIKNDKYLVGRRLVNYNHVKSVK